MRREVLVAAAIGLLALAGEAAAQITAVATAHVNVRALPAKGAAVVRVLAPGDSVELVGDTAARGYRRIAVAGDTGWAFARFLRISLAGREFLSAARTAAALRSLPRNSPLRVPRGRAETFQQCAPEGSGTRNDPELNLRKNRIDAGSYIDVELSAIAMTRPTPRRDHARRGDLTPQQRDSVAVFEGLPLRTRGFLTVDRRPIRAVLGAEEMAGESTNCGEAGGLDFHLWMTPSGGQDRSHAVVVEMTPRVRGSHPGWTVARLREVARRGLPVRVSGWLMFDQEHVGQLHEVVRRNGTVQNQTRATLWEIHPVMELEVCDAATPQVCTPLDDWRP